VVKFAFFEWEEHAVCFSKAETNVAFYFGLQMPAKLLTKAMIETANIAGAGIGGLTAAIALAQRGVEVQLYEQAPALGEVGAGLQLSPNAVKVLTALGLKDLFHSVEFEPENAVIKDGRTSMNYVSVPLKNVCRDTYGAPYLHVHRSDLHRVLCNTAEQLGVKMHLNSRIEGYDCEGFLGCRAVDLSISADGVRSACSSQMNPHQPPRFTGQVAWRGTVPINQIPRGLISPDATVWVGPGKHIVTYFVRGGSLVNFVAVEERETWTDPSWTSLGDISELQSTFAGWHPTIETLLSCVSEANIWALYDKPALVRWSDGPVTLLGDACHPTLPFLAQGAAMAVEDAYVLAKCVGGDNSLARALLRYEALRKPRTTMLQNKARGNADMFHLGGPAGGLLSKAKLNIARFLPAKLSMLPFKAIYGYDATKILDTNWSQTA
jgi:salicylate hydroxylase